MNPAEALFQARSSDCSTALFRPWVSADGGDIRNIDNGYSEGGLAINLVAHGSDDPYVGVRMGITSNKMPTTLAQGSPTLDFVSDFRIPVWDYETHELRATTDNLAAVLNTLPRYPAFDREQHGRLVAELTEPLTLREGEWVLLGTSLYGDYPCRQIGNNSINCNKALMGCPPVLAFNNKSAVITGTAAGAYPTGDYEGGVPGRLGFCPSGNYPWVDLLTESQMP